MAGARGTRATTRRPAARKPTATTRRTSASKATPGKAAASRPAAGRRPAAKQPATRRRPAAGRTAGPGWWQRVATACALLAALGALAGVVVATWDSNRVEDRTVVLDVRSPEEFAAGHLEGAVNLDAEASDLAERVAVWDAANSFIVYCRTGHRARVVVDLLTSLGFTDVVNAGSLHTAAWTTRLDIVR